MDLDLQEFMEVAGMEETDAGKCVMRDDRH